MLYVLISWVQTIILREMIKGINQMSRIGLNPPIVYRVRRRIILPDRR